MLTIDFKKVDHEVQPLYLDMCKFDSLKEEPP